MRSINIVGARTHNLRNVTLSIPRGRFVVVTGVSGSGKSSLVFDTICAEARRRYAESLSPSVRRFLSLGSRPDADLIEGLSPAVAVSQAGIRSDPRSTVGSITHALDFLRLLFARAGTPHCPRHGLPLEATPISVMAEKILSWPEGEPAIILAPRIFSGDAGFGEFFSRMTRLGFERFRIDGRMTTRDEMDPAALEGSRHTVDAVVDRLKLRTGSRERLTESLELAASLASGRAGAVRRNTGEELIFSTGYSCPVCDYTCPDPSPALFSAASSRGRCEARGGRESGESDGTLRCLCPTCGGSGLSEAAQSVFIDFGGEKRSLPHLLSLPASDLAALLPTISLSGARRAAADAVLPHILGRIGFLTGVGLGYLSLDRAAPTLSRGEAQRARLAAELGSDLTGVLYVLDEPSAGLHPSEAGQLTAALKRLRDAGNTVIAAEHNREIILAADYIVDMGPGAGELGGRVVATGTPEEIAANPDSPTGRHLKAAPFPVPEGKPNAGERGWIRIRGAAGNNLKNVSASFPIGCMSAVSGVSGSGKSSLVIGTLLAEAQRRLSGSHAVPLPFEEVNGLEAFDAVAGLDQAPMGKSARSVVATQIGVFQAIRELFAETRVSRERGYGPERFSFNLKGGRCEACEGEGVCHISMEFLPDVDTTCEVCGGTRYNRETLEPRLMGLSIAEVLDLTAAAAADFFRAHPGIARKLRALETAGLGYLRLGQSTLTLSGGEAQRLRIARALSGDASRRTLYILDEPSSGLHFDDVSRLISALRSLCGAGGTVIVIEHDPVMISSADWVVDLGGSGVLAEGTPRDVAASPSSVTARYIAPLISG